MNITIPRVIALGLLASSVTVKAEVFSNADLQFALKQETQQSLVTFTYEFGQPESLDDKPGDEPKKVVGEKSVDTTKTPDQKGGNENGATEVVSKKDDKSQNGLKKFSDVITEDAITSKGIFATHLVDNKLYFELPENILSREFIWQTKVAATEYEMGQIGTSTSLHYVAFERIGDSLYLFQRQYNVLYPKGEKTDAAYQAATLDPILASFDIVAKGKNDTLVIEVTDAFNGTIKEFKNGTSSLEKKIKGFNADKKSTRFLKAKAFEQNVEVRLLAKFVGSEGSVTNEMRHSIYALPETVMKPRIDDKRVGFFPMNTKNTALTEIRSLQRGLFIVGVWRKRILPRH